MQDQLPLSWPAHGQLFRPWISFHWQGGPVAKLEHMNSLSRARRTSSCTESLNATWKSIVSGTGHSAGLRSTEKPSERYWRDRGTCAGAGAAPGDAGLPDEAGAAALVGSVVVLTRERTG